MALRLTTILNRREFSRLCAAAGASVMASKASALDPAPGGAPGDAKRTVKLRDGRLAPALGQGSARLGKGRHPATEEEQALRAGLELGMTLIDTAEL